MNVKPVLRLILPDRRFAKQNRICKARKRRRNEILEILTKICFEYGHILCIAHFILYCFGSKAEFPKADKLRSSGKVIPLQARTDPVGLQEVDAS